MHKPADIPRLPVFSWDMLGRGADARPMSVLDTPHRLFTSSGRAAIALGLEHLGIKAGDKVLLPTYHCPTMIAPAVKLGARPCFYPLCEDGSPDLGTLRSMDLTGARAILVPHYFGRPQPMRLIREFCDHTGIALIEDCAHAFFGRADGRAIGQWGDIAIASLTKFFPVPDGGVLASPRAPLRTHPQSTPGLMTEIRAVLDVVELGASFDRLPGLNTIFQVAFKAKRRLRRAPIAEAGTCPASEVHTMQTAGPELQAFDMDLARRKPPAVTRIVPQWFRASKIVTRRRENYALLARELSGFKGFEPLFSALPEHAAPYVFPLRVDAPDEKYFELKRRGIPVFRWNLTWPGSPVDEAETGFRWSREVFQLACHQSLSPQDLARIRDTVVEVCADKADLS